MKTSCVALNLLRTFPVNRKISNNYHGNKKREYSNQSNKKHGRRGLVLTSSLVAAAVLTDNPGNSRFVCLFIPIVCAVF